MENNAQGKMGYTIAWLCIAVFCFVAALSKVTIPPDTYIYFFVLFLLAFSLELFSVELPYYGHASVAYPIYFFTMLHPYAGMACGAFIMAFIAILIRNILKSRQPIWLRIKDFVASISCICISAATFYFIFPFLTSAMLPGNTAEGGVQINTMLLSPHENLPILLPLLLSAACSALAFFFADIIIGTTIAADFLEESHQKNWNEIKSKLRGIIFIYFSFAIALFLAYTINIWLAVVIMPIFFVLQNHLKYVVQEVSLIEQESIAQELNTKKVELSEKRLENKLLNEDLQKKIDEISIVYEMGKALGASINLDDTYNIIISMVGKLILYQSCVIFLLEKGNLTPAKYVTPYKETLAMSPLLQLEETIVSLVVQNRQPMLIPDIQTVNEQRIFKDEKCVMCVPLIIKEKIIGVFYVGNTKKGAYNDEQLNILSILANSAAIAIESAQLYEEKEHSLVISKSINNKLEKTVKQLSALNEFGKSLVSSLNMDETLDFITLKMKNIIDYQSFIIFTMHTKDSNAATEIFAKRCVGPYVNLFKNVAFDASDGVLGWVISQKKPLLLEDTKNSRLPNVVSQERSSIIVPMVVENEAIGAFYVGASMPNYYDEEAMNLVATVTYQTAMAVKNAELYEKMVALAITDGLTGLYTHRYFQERLVETCREYERTLKTFTLVMVDVDNFKTYNDTLGHPEGDKLLQEIAALIKSYTRDSDLVCRYGGDEFAVILKESDKENSVRIAERIREAFQFKFGSYKVKITSSIGVANFPMDATNKPDLLAAADAALYKSKKGGRNAVNWAVPLSETGGVFVVPEIQAPLPRAADANKKPPQGMPSAAQIPPQNRNANMQINQAQNLPKNINIQNMSPQQQMQYKLHLQQQQRILQQQQQQSVQTNAQQQSQPMQKLASHRQAALQRLSAQNQFNIKNSGEKPDINSTRVLNTKPGAWPPPTKPNNP